MDEHEDLIQRLRDAGRRPIDPTVRSTHLASLECRPTLLRSKLRVAGAFLAGLLVGGSGLAAAGALPDPAQNVAHNVFEKVGVQVPQPERHHGEECGAERKRNHGQYVRVDKALAQTECGKPLATAGGDAEDDGERDAEKARGKQGPKKAGESGPCAGPPPWASDKSMTAEQKAAAQADREATCGPDEDGAAAGSDAGRAPADTTAPTETTTTTTEPTTTTSTTTTEAEPTTTTAA